MNKAFGFATFAAALLASTWGAAPAHAINNCDWATNGTYSEVYCNDQGGNENITLGINTVNPPWYWSNTQGWNQLFAASAPPGSNIATLGVGNWNTGVSTNDYTCWAAAGAVNGQLQPGFRFNPGGSNGGTDQQINCNQVLTIVSTDNGTMDVLNEIFNPSQDCGGFCDSGSAYGASVGSAAAEGVVAGLEGLFAF